MVESLRERWRVQIDAALSATEGKDQVEHHHKWLRNFESYILISGSSMIEDGLTMTCSRFLTLLSQCLEYYTSEKEGLKKAREVVEECLVHQVEGMKEEHSRQVAFQSISQGVRDDTTRQHQEDMVVVVEAVRSQVDKWRHSIQGFTIELQAQLQEIVSRYEDRLATREAEGHLSGVDEVLMIKEDYMKRLIPAGELCCQRSDAMVATIWDKEVVQYSNNDYPLLITRLHTTLEHRVKETIRRAVDSSKIADDQLEKEVVSLVEGVYKECGKNREEILNACWKFFKVR